MTPKMKISVARKSNQRRLAKLEREASRSAQKPTLTMFPEGSALETVKGSMRGVEKMLTFAPSGDHHVRSDIQLELTRTLKKAVADGELKELHLVYHADRAMSKGGVRGEFDGRASARLFRNVKKTFQHAFSCAVPICVPTAQNADGYEFAVVIATIAVHLGEQRHSNHIARSLAGGQSGGTVSQLGLVPFSKSNPTEADVDTVIKAFMDAPASIGRKAHSKERADTATWRSSARARRFTCQLFGMLTPAEKSFFGAGIGEAIVKRGLTGGSLRAKAAKRRPDSIDRALLIHMLWLNAKTQACKDPPHIAF